jgi:hypothetical protein
VNTIESAFVLIDRATGPIRGIRRELKGLTRDATEAGVAMDAIGGPRNQRRLDETSRSMRVMGEDTRRTRGELQRADNDMRRVESSATGLSRRTRELGVNWSFLGKVLGFLKFPAIIAGVGGLMQAIGGLTAGVVGLIPELARAGGAGAALIPVYAGIGLTMGVVKLATSDLSQALHGNQQALKRLTPEGRAFLQTLRGFKPTLDAIKGTAQRNLFPGLTAGLRDLKREAPAIRQIVGMGARNTGNLAGFFGNQLRQRDVMPNLIRLAGVGDRAITHLGHAGFYLADALAHVGVAAGPLTDWLGRSIEGWTKQADQQARVAEETGRLDTWFIRVRHSISLLWDTGQHVFHGLVGFMHAASGESQSLWTSVDHVAARFDKWANSMQGQGSIAAWFERERPALSATVHLFGQLALAIGSLSSGSQGGTMLDSIGHALPALVSGIKEITTMFGPPVIDALGNVIQLLADATGATGPLTLFVKAIGTVAGLMDHLVRATGGFGRVLATALAFGLLVRKARAIEGIANAWQKVQIWAGRATAAEEEQAGVNALNNRATAIGGMARQERRYAGAARDAAVATETQAAMGGGLPFMPLRRGRRPNDTRVSPYLGEVIGGGGPTATAEGALLGAGGASLWSRFRGRLGGARTGVSNFFRGTPMYETNPEDPFGRGMSTGRGPRFGGLRAGARAVPGGIASAARFVMPLMLMSGLLQAAGGNPGLSGVGGAGEAFLSGATFGAIPENPAPGSGAARAQRHLGNFADPTNLRTLNMRIGAVNRAAGGLEGATQAQGGTLGQPHWKIAADVFGGRTAGEARSNAEALKVYNNELARLRRLRTQITTTRQQTRAQSIFSDFTHAFDIRAAAKGPEKALAQMKGNMLDQLKTLPPAGRAVFRRGVESWGLELVAAHPELRGKVNDLNRGMIRQLRRLGPQGRKGVAQNMLDWATEQARQNPKLWGVVHDLQKDIRNDFSTTGDRVKIVNGRILTGSQDDWTRIRKAISSQTEQAKEEVTTDFTAIQQQAIGSLQAMGFSGAEARKLVANTEKGGGTGIAARAAVASGGRNDTATARGLGANPQAAKNARRARGGRLHGFGFSDNVLLPDGGRGAPGELIVNRHTERDVDRDLALAGRPRLSRRVAHEGRRHFDPPPRDDGDDILPDRDLPLRHLGLRRRARGGRVLARWRASILGTSDVGDVGGGGGGGRGGSGSFPAMVAKAREIESHHYPYLWGGGHNANFSPPYDCSGAVSAVLHAGGALGSPLTSGNFMSFGDPGKGDVTLFANAGHVFMALGGKGFGTSNSNPGGGAGWLPYNSRPGFVVRHVPVRGGGALGDRRRGAGTLGNVHLHGPQSRLGGVPGALSTRAGAIYAKGLQQKLNHQLGQMGGFAGVPGGGGAADGEHAAWPPDDARRWMGREPVAGAARALAARVRMESERTEPVERRAGIPQALGHGDVFIGDDPRADRVGPALHQGPLRLARGRVGP